MCLIRRVMCRHKPTKKVTIQAKDSYCSERILILEPYIKVYVSKGQEVPNVMAGKRLSRVVILLFSLWHRKRACKGFFLTFRKVERRSLFFCFDCFYFLFSRSHFFFSDFHFFFSRK